MATLRAGFSGTLTAGERSLHAARVPVTYGLRQCCHSRLPEVSSAASCSGRLDWQTAVSTRWYRRIPTRVLAVAEERAEEDALSPESLEAREFAVAMAKVASDVKVQDLTVLHVEPLVSWTSYMVVCTVFSKPQLQAVVARMEDAAVADWGRSKSNSVGSSPWEVIDFGSVVVHVFTPDQREFYDIESFYAAADEVDLPFEVQQQPQEQQQRGSVASISSSWKKAIK